MNRQDPRVRQTLDRISTTLETANTAAQTTLYDFSSQYINPCVESVSQCFSSTCAPCVDFTRERARARQRAVLRSQRPEAVFDFYADWEEDLYDYDGNERVDGGSPSTSRANERTGLLSGWGADNLDRLLAGRAKEDQQPRRQAGMSYGTARTRRGSGNRTASLAKGEIDDPNVVPSSSKFGFLERLPFKLGPRGLRYKPSAANMQEGLFQRRGDGDAIHEGEEEEMLRDRTEGDALLDDIDGEGDLYRSSRRHQRNRSGTVNSGHTDGSMSSRGDLFPSDEEDDAVMLDDDMAMALGRRNTNELESPQLEGASTRGRRKRPSASRRSTRSSFARSKSSKSLASKGRSLSGDSMPAVGTALEDSIELPEPAQELEMDPEPEPEPELEIPTIEQLREEEQQARAEVEEEVRRKRREAQDLAISRGLIDETESGQNSSADTRLASAIEHAPSDSHHGIGEVTTPERTGRKDDDNDDDKDIDES